MPLGRGLTWLYLVLAVVSAISASYFAHDTYTNRVATELIRTVLKTEAASIQQGNLLSSIAKLQGAVNSSESLRAIAILDRNLPSNGSHPLLLIGERFEKSDAWLQDAVIRAGLFRRIYQRSVTPSQVLKFYFDPRFVYWSFLTTSLVVIAFAAIIGILAGRLESIRGEERASALVAVSQQVSHDVKSPLTALKMMSAVLQSRGVETELMQMAIERMEGILADLESQAKPKANSLAFTDLNALACQLTKEKGFEHPGFRFEFQDRAPAWVSGPIDPLKRVLSNVINNAVEASPPGSIIRVELTQHARELALAVTDEGQGMSPEVLKRLFRRGFTFGKAGGSGLGLHHARRVVTALGGRIDVVSEVESGTRVLITFPRLSSGDKSRS